MFGGKYACGELNVGGWERITHKCMTVNTSMGATRGRARRVVEVRWGMGEHKRGGGEVRWGSWWQVCLWRAKRGGMGEDNTQMYDCKDA